MQEEAELMQLDSSKPYPVPQHDPFAEKWVDLDGTNTFFLRMIFGNLKDPITEVNFFNITTKSDVRFVSYPLYCSKSPSSMILCLVTA